MLIIETGEAAYLEGEGEVLNWNKRKATEGKYETDSGREKIRVGSN